MLKLISFASNCFSQHGEDGVIEKIFERIGAGKRVCIEFGAWDGYRFSNTAHLWTNGWRGILIEGNPERAALLKKNVEPYDCVAICSFVGIKIGAKLEDILRENNIVLEADLLSIDVDGDDYYIFNSLSELRPRVVICEYNPTIPYWLDLYAEPGSYFGSSVAALNRIGREKGYRLVAVTETNCIFVREGECCHLADVITDIDMIAVTKGLNFIITSYSGEYYVYGGMPYGLNVKCRTLLHGDQQARGIIQHNARTMIYHRKHVRMALREIHRLIKNIFSSRLSAISPVTRR